MTSIDLDRGAPQGSVATYRIVDLFAGAMTSISRRFAARRTYVALNSLGDAQLRDIGLERKDIKRVSSALDYHR